MLNSPQSLIDAASLVIESFDSPLATVDIPSSSMLHQMGSMSAAMMGGDNFKMKKIDDQGYLIQFDKDGKTEVHHVDESLQGGKRTGDGKSAIRFMSTMAHHVKGLLDQDKTVKVVAHRNLADNFRRVTDHLVSRNPGYQASASTNETHEITGDPLVSWELKRK